MRLTSFTDFGLRALMRLAAEPERLFTADEISKTNDLSRNHMNKIIQALSAARIIVTQRGAGGGFRLARPADEITLGEVVRKLEARYALVECFRADGGNCILTPGCRLKGHLNSAREAFLRELDQTTLSECAWSDGIRDTAS